MTGLRPKGVVDAVAGIDPVISGSSVQREFCTACT